MKAVSQPRIASASIDSLSLRTDETFLRSKRVHGGLLLYLLARVQLFFEILRTRHDVVVKKHRAANVVAGWRIAAATPRPFAVASNDESFKGCGDHDDKRDSFVGRGHPSH